MNALAVVLAAVLMPSPACVPAQDCGVAPIAWQRFHAGPPTDDQAVRTRTILLNANRYALRTWYPAKYGSQAGQYLDLGGTAEPNVRPPGSEALALATSLATGAYDEQVTGFPPAQARDVAVRIVSSIAYHHVANEPGGWGRGWQTPLWAFNAAFAGWLLWDDLPAPDRERLARMVRTEADAFLFYTVPYYQDPSGKVITPGDSKAEENAWNAAFLNLAVSMMPDDPNRAIWQDKALELMVSAYSRPSDLTNQTVVNGKPVAQWLHGSNIFEDGTLVNHGIIHPDYFTSIANDAGAPLAYGLAGLPTPTAAFHNADVVYDALVNHEFSSPPYAAPGGTIYVHGPSADIYYPQGNDWGTSRQMHFLLLDTLAATFGFGDGTEWAVAHAERALQMQGRFPDGRTYGPSSEDTYAGREEWVALLAGRTYLTHWLSHNAELEVTNRVYPVPPSTPPGTVNVALGRPVSVSSALRDTSSGDKAVDGLFTDDSRWISAPADQAPTLTVDLGATRNIAAVYVYSGYKRTNNDLTSVLKDFTVEVHTTTGWQHVAGIADNMEYRVAVPSLHVQGDQVRLSISDPSRSETDVARVFEVEVYARP